MIEVELQASDVNWTARPLMNYETHQVVDHVYLMMDAGLLEGYRNGGHGMTVHSLTPTGLNLLLASKDAISWRKARDRVIAAGLPLSVSTISAALELPMNERIS